MEPDSLCFLTLITKLRVIRRSAFGVRRSAKYSGHLYTTATFFYPQGSTKVSPLWSGSTVVKNTPLEMRRARCPRRCDVCPKSKIKEKIPAWITDVFIAQSENKYPVICNRNPVSPFPNFLNSSQTAFQSSYFIKKRSSVRTCRVVSVWLRDSRV